MGNDAACTGAVSLRPKLALDPTRHLRHRARSRNVMTRIGPRLSGIGIVVMIFGLPLLGTWLAGRPIADLFHFPPPLEIPRDYVRFSWAAAAPVLLLLAAVFLPWCRPSGNRIAFAGNGEIRAARPGGPSWW